MELVQLISNNGSFAQDKIASYVLKLVFYWKMIDFSRHFVIESTGFDSQWEMFGVVVRIPPYTVDPVLSTSVPSYEK